ncbi:MAG: hypothetical protein QW699_01395, partial [Metallosphaera sp.]
MSGVNGEGKLSGNIDFPSGNIYSPSPIFSVFDGNINGKFNLGQSYLYTGDFGMPQVVLSLNNEGNNNMYITNEPSVSPSFISITTPLVLVTNLSIANPGNSTLVIDSIQVNALEQLVFSTSSVSGTSSFPGVVFGAANDTLENPIVIPPLSVENYQTELVIPVTSEFFQTQLSPQELFNQKQFTFSVSYIEL